MKLVVSAGARTERAKGQTEAQPRLSARRQGVGSSADMAHPPQEKVKLEVPEAPEEAPVQNPGIQQSDTMEVLMEATVNPVLQGVWAALDSI